MVQAIEDMTKIPAARLVKRYEELLLLVPVLGAYKAEMERRLHNGDKVPGYMLAPGNSIRVWENMTRTKTFLRKLGYTRDEYEPRAMLSVAQMEKLVSPAQLAPYVTKIPGNKRMVKSS